MSQVVPRILYDKTQWKIRQKGYGIAYTAKSESIMAQGNGNIGIRAADEESALTKYHRNMFIAGSFNKPSLIEAPELPNLPDITNLDIKMNDVFIKPTLFDHETYRKSLNLKDGELKRSFTATINKATVKVVTRRFVSMADTSLVCFRTIVKVKKGTINHLSAQFGIDGQQTNSGVQHFDEGLGQYYKEDSIIQYSMRTTQSNLAFSIQVGFKAFFNDERVDTVSAGSGNRRQVKAFAWARNLKEGDVFVIERTCNVVSNINYQNRLLIQDALNAQALLETQKYMKISYKELLENSKNKWSEIWRHYDIKVESDSHDNLAFRFAVYHLMIMTPKGTTYATPGAKGLTGEVYKGHAFWDNEIFIVPVYSYMNPQIARNMMFYRYRNLLGARKKAKENGYKGAMYPWEAAFPYDAEACPKYGNIDGETGETSIVWPGIIEQHPTADVAYGVSWYCEVTRDMDFLCKYGFEIIFEVARFWTSRVEYNEEKDYYEIKNVIGPNEYKEHIDNNAFTNYMARWTIEWIFEHSKIIFEDIWKEEFDKIVKKLGVSDNELKKMKEVMNKLHLPPENEDGIVSENETYLSLPDIPDIEVYKDPNRWITKEIPWTIVKNSQVTKQADVICLMWLLRWKFNSSQIIKNLEYYDLRTVHESSLSYNTYALLAIQENTDKAMYFYRKACQIDMGTNLRSSDEGIHAASLGGIWQMFYFGFAGVSAYKELYISPRLPETWKSLFVKFYYHGNLVKLWINHDEVKIKVRRSKNDFSKYVSVDRPDNLIEYKKSGSKKIMVTFNKEKVIEVDGEHVFKMDKEMNILKDRG